MESHEAVPCVPLWPHRHLYVLGLQLVCQPVGYILLLRAQLFPLPHTGAESAPTYGLLKVAPEVVLGTPSHRLLSPPKGPGQPDSVSSFTLSTASPQIHRSTRE